MSDARENQKRADKKLQGGFLSCLAGNRRFEEAAELYQQAAQGFKLAKEWQEAANCFIQCAYCAGRLGDANEESNSYVEAGNLLSRISTNSAVEQWESAISMQNAAGKFGASGKLLMKIAELHESERLDHKECREYYKRAAEMFDLDDHSKSSFTKCRIKMADYAALDGELQAAVRIFEEEGEKALQGATTAFGAKEHFLKAGLLQLQSGDTITMQLAVDRYQQTDPRFADSREGALLSGLVEAFEAGDAEAFLDRLQEYNQVTKLDQWKTEVLLKVKELLQPSGADAVEDVDLT